MRGVSARVAPVPVEIVFAQGRRGTGAAAQPLAARMLASLAAALASATAIEERAKMCARASPVSDGAAATTSSSTAPALNTSALAARAITDISPTACST